MTVLLTFTSKNASFLDKVLFCQKKKTVVSANKQLYHLEVTKGLEDAVIIDRGCDIVSLVL